MRSDPSKGFVVWLTGLPASGKSTVARALANALESRGVRAAVLESDVVRREVTPVPTYSETERDAFYATLGYLARTLATNGVPVIVDATANRRAYRDRARAAIPSFFEVHVKCALAVCRARDPKGIYRRGMEGTAPNIPGLSAPYEPPLRPELVVDGEREAPEDAARRIVEAIDAAGFLGARGPRARPGTSRT